MTARKSYKVRAQVWLYPGDAAWHFVHIDKKQSAEIKEKYGKIRRGFGSVRARVTLGETTWDTSIFPDKQSGTYLLPLKAQVRRVEQVEAGEYIDFVIQPRD